MRKRRNLVPPVAVTGSQTLHPELGEEGRIIHFTIWELPQLQADTFPGYHSRNSYRKKWHSWVAHGIKKAGGPPSEPWGKAGIVAVRFAIGSEPDRGNLVHSFKPVVDGLIAKRAGVIEDDKPSVLVTERYEWRKCRRADARIEVWVMGPKAVTDVSWWRERCHHCARL